jgi:hypothetical protein
MRAYGRLLLKTVSSLLPLELSSVNACVFFPFLFFSSKNLETQQTIRENLPKHWGKEGEKENKPKQSPPVTDSRRVYFILLSLPANVNSYILMDHVPMSKYFRKL